MSDMFFWGFLAGIVVQTLVHIGIDFYILRHNRRMEQAKQ